MTKRGKIATLLAAVLLASLAATAALSLARVSVEAGEYHGRETGEVLVGGRLVMTLYTSAAGRTPLERAEIAADRLERIPEERFDSQHVAVRSVGGEQRLYVGDRLIVSVSSTEARAHGTSPAALAKVWRDNLLRATGGTPTGGDEPCPPRDDSYADWVGAKQKWVPILSVENEGLRVGAAQVAGPAGQVDQTKAVAQVRLDFRKLARVYAYIPIVEVSVSDFHRVQGVSVWATGDLQLVEF